MEVNNTLLTLSNTLTLDLEGFVIRQTHPHRLYSIGNFLCYTKCIDCVLNIQDHIHSDLSQFTQPIKVIEITANDAGYNMQASWIKTNSFPPNGINDIPFSFYRVLKMKTNIFFLVLPDPNVNLILLTNNIILYYIIIVLVKPGICIK